MRFLEGAAGKAEDMFVSPAVLHGFMMSSNHFEKKELFELGVFSSHPKTLHHIPLNIRRHARSIKYR
jgi:hypothetical protein